MGKKSRSIQASTYRSRGAVAAMAAHMLDIFRRLRATYALLEPLLFDEDIVRAWSGGLRSDGFHVIRNALLHACVLDAAKLTLDRDLRSASLTQLIDSLGDERLVSELRESFSVWGIGPYSEFEPDVHAIIAVSQRRDEANRRVEFDQLVKRLSAGWDHLQESTSLRSFNEMRNKIVAHNEMQFDGDTFRAFDVGRLGLKLGDLRIVIEALEDLINQANLIFRATSFDFQELRQQTSNASKAFWVHPL